MHPILKACAWASFLAILATSLTACCVLGLGTRRSPTAEPGPGVTETVTPPPTPDPGPSATTTPPPAPDPDPTATTTPSPAPDPDSTATTTPSPAPDPDPTATTTPTPVPDPSPTATTTPPTCASWTSYTSSPNGPADNYTRAIAAAPDGTMWIGTSNGGVSRFDGQTWATFLSGHGLVNDTIDAIAVAPDGTVWAGGWGGASCFDGTVWTTYTEEDGLPGYGVNAIAVAADGAVWFGTTAGATRFDGHSWTTYTKADGLANDGVQAIAVAPDGALWFSSLRGVSRFDGHSWTTYTADDGVILDPTSIAVALDGTVWVGADMFGGAASFDGHSWITYTTQDGLPGQFVHSIAAAPDGSVWFGASADRYGGGGIARYDGQRWTTHDCPAGNDVRAITTAPDGAVWFGTFNNGVARCGMPVGIARPAAPPATNPPIPGPLVMLRIDGNAQSDYQWQPTGFVILGDVGFSLSEQVLKTQASTPPYDDYTTHLSLKTEISAKKVHLLLNAGNGFNEFEGRVVGQVVAYCNDTPTVLADLRLGQEVREWHTGDNVVSTATRSRQVWSTFIADAPGETGFIDMLSLDLPEGCQEGHLTAIEVIDTSVDTIGSLDPALILTGVTVEMQW